MPFLPLFIIPLIYVDINIFLHVRFRIVRCYYQGALREFCLLSVVLFSSCTVFVLVTLLAYFLFLYCEFY